MSKELVISADLGRSRVAILAEGQLVEIYIEREKEFALSAASPKGKVTRVLPGMQSRIESTSAWMETPSSTSATFSKIWKITITDTEKHRLRRSDEPRRQVPPDRSASGRVAGGFGRQAYTSRFCIWMTRQATKAIWAKSATAWIMVRAREKDPMRERATGRKFPS